ncbi:ankyrin repeat domain-containing protein [Rhizobium ruizarguesonis]|uniref:ankyrin repeat domain-containing protein n=1 Tax=Rhizobium ruizarguesonis TaxID=2081791 RepID=UPI0013EE9DDF|nr:ankyrin repeat domain-containing protein [Rhizobium ruizarguesonis]MBY5855039.1 ankyrin repeat domain-containing protein [Rhizobium leguminosarum]MBY5889774.1 ankyrin repeat domain-containing protein [Rhizobium leguminosarum]QSZ03259.1 ankyrin repeat domain-containing protein [Rhizobium ruizarguesonis]
MRWLLALPMAGLAMASPAASAQTLFDAVASGDRHALEQALAGGAKVDDRAADQATPLIAAALGKQADIVELLLNKGADVTARNSGGFTPLHAAAYAGSAAIARQLLAKGASLDDAANKAGVTPLMVAGEQNHLDVAVLLIAEGADPSHPEIHGYLPITRALWKGNKDIVHLYKQHGVTCPPAKILGSEEWYQKCLSY